MMGFQTDTLVLKIIIEGQLLPFLVRQSDQRI